MNDVLIKKIQQDNIFGDDFTIIHGTDVVAGITVFGRSKEAWRHCNIQQKTLNK